MIAVIDNYDSFTYNLVQYLGELGADIAVYRNDQITVPELEQLVPSHIIISPGPGTPEQAGISGEVVTVCGPHIPVLGVCLGHQTIGRVFGGTVRRADVIMHGKVSTIYHDGQGLYRGIAGPFTATRYHSLIVDATVPSCLKVTAHTADGVVMGLRHVEYPVEGVQFHPESILTGEGKTILRNFLRKERA
ncbi:anthranilate synthase component ii signature [Lucifera butyrica]|uniref:Anthranilate synthase component ii signature n=1 Tax=Lucifera butyrica TaxID=1351585 RepID=A0A498R662_9FIRM|nr:aminodeoxychorismate/anthranilate synthase component II [Lucifera butyrica]VBB06659.1 anthranilate synthase component ii signature [Lucifera butyrica]